MLSSAIALYILLSVIVAVLGNHRKFGFWGYFFASLLFTPFIGLIMVFASDKVRPDQRAA